jgi:hypothetical protein
MRMTGGALAGERVRPWCIEPYCQIERAYWRRKGKSFELDKATLNEFVVQETIVEPLAG